MTQAVYAIPGTSAAFSMEEQDPPPNLQAKAADESCNRCQEDGLRN